MIDEVTLTKVKQLSSLMITKAGGARAPAAAAPYCLSRRGALPARCGRGAGALQGHRATVQFITIKSSRKRLNLPSVTVTYHSSLRHNHWLL